MKQMTASEIRANWREVLERVQHGEDIEVTQSGKVVAAVVHPAKLRARVQTPNTVRAAELLAELRAARLRPSLDMGAIDPAYGEALVRDIRRDRDEE